MKIQRNYFLFFVFISSFFTFCVSKNDNGIDQNDPMDTLKADYKKNSISDTIQSGMEYVENYLGDYYSTESCELEMPRFIEESGPRLTIKIYKKKSNKSSQELGSLADSTMFYCNLEYCGNFSGQFAYNNNTFMMCDIIKCTKTPNSVTFTIKPAKCYSYYSLDEWDGKLSHNEKTTYRKTLDEFDLVMKKAAGDSIRFNISKPIKGLTNEWKIEKLAFNFHETKK